MNLAEVVQLRALAASAPLSMLARLGNPAFLLAGLFLQGCTTGPDYQRPSALPSNALPASFSAGAAPTNWVDWKAAEPSAHLPRGTWWNVYEDPELDRLEAMAGETNQELKAAAARIEQARAFLRVSQAARLPDLTFAPGYTRQRTSAYQPESDSRGDASRTFNSFSLPLESSWELDLWGRVRRQVEAAQGRLAATVEDREAARLAIQAEVATDYFALRSMEAELRLLERSTEAFRRSLALTQNRRRGGIASDLDVSQAETQLRATEAEVPAVQLQLTRVKHALAVLCGQAATGFAIHADPEASRFGVPEIPSAIPSELLERRPDISAAERRMSAANAEIGVAQSAFYPRVRLNGMAGVGSIDASSLFNWPARIWAIGPSIELPLFTGGRNRALLAEARAAYDETVAQYRQRVLEAFQEVEDQLAARQLLGTELNAEQAALAAAQRTLEIANNRYRAGLVTYLEVALAQSSALTRERSVVRLRSQTLAASAGLIRSLGGAW